MAFGKIISPIAWISNDRFEPLQLGKMNLAEYFNGLLLAEMILQNTGGTYSFFILLTTYGFCLLKRMCICLLLECI